jgi:hypothetical protein
MRPKKPETTGSGDLFRARLDQIINLKHELAQLAGQIDWDFISQFDDRFSLADSRLSYRVRFSAGLRARPNILQPMGGRCSTVASARFIPRLIDQNRCAHWRNPMDMIFQGRSMSVFQA